MHGLTPALRRAASRRAADQTKENDDDERRKHVERALSTVKKEGEGERKRERERERRMDIDKRKEGPVEREASGGGCSRSKKGEHLLEIF